MDAKQLLQVKLPENEEEQEKVIKTLEERLEKHDENRKAIQCKLTEVLNKLTEQIGELEDRINKGLEENFIPEDDRLQAAFNELRGNGSAITLQKVKAELSTIQSYEIIENKKANFDLATFYELKTERRTIPVDVSVGFAISEVNGFTNGTSNATEKDEIPCDSDKFGEERERLIGLLKERIEEHDNNRKVVQDNVHYICEGLRAKVKELGDRISKELEEKFTSEDNRLQTALNELRGNRTASALQKAKAELFVEQLYEIIENNLDSKHDLTTSYELKTEKRIVPELIVMRKPTDVRTAGVNRGRVSIQFTFFNPDEERILSDNTIVNPAKYKCMIFKKDNEQENKEYPLDKNEDNDSSFTFTPDILEAKTTYGTRVKMVVGDRESEWCDEVAEFITTEFKECCVWKKCPGYVDKDKKYSVDEKNPRIATKIYGNGRFCTIIGSTPIPLGTTTSWSIKVLGSRDNVGWNIYVGVAPFDINQDADYNDDNGWFFDCYGSKLRSGPPHNHKREEYGPRKERGGQYVHAGDSVGVVMDTSKGELSFVLDEVNLGVAFEGIPLDKPLVPCVILQCQGDSVELDISDVKENVDSSVPVPSTITVKNITWDTITFTWNKVKGALFYQVEVDGSISCDIVTTNSFTKRGLLPETKHSFRVRTVRGSSVGEWSGVVKGRTLKAPEFSECVWKKCPDHVVKGREYNVNWINYRIAKRINDYEYCTIIGNTYIPLNTVASWSVKILKSKNNNGNCIYIGVAPFDIDQDNKDNYNECGWYFDCLRSWLYSGPPHNYEGKVYGPRKRKGEYVHTRDSVGVVVDTTRGDLSFALDRVNLGVAYSGIPLDKPLVPCVILLWKGDSVELITSEVKENEVDNSIPVPSNITSKNVTWDSITLSWDKVSDATFYQIEVDGSKSWDATTENSFTKRGLLPEAEHSFRVRTVRGNSVSEWSDVVKGRTIKSPDFSECVWKECPDDIDDDKKYSVDGENPRIATKVNDCDFCTIMGSTHIPLNTVTSWSVKILKSKKNDGWDIYIGIAPSDINQNEVVNRNKCGWYFDCYWSWLYSGPPHKYERLIYGPRKGEGRYIHTGDTVGVVMDTAKGELSFVLDGVNHDVACEGIPLDKPLVPCVLLNCRGDSVELII